MELRLDFKADTKCPHCQKNLKMTSNEVRSSSTIICSFCNNRIQIDGSDFARSEDEINRELEKKLGNLSLNIKL